MTAATAVYCVTCGQRQPVVHAGQPLPPYTYRDESAARQQADAWNAKLAGYPERMRALPWYVVPVTPTPAPPPELTLWGASDE